MTREELERMADGIVRLRWEIILRREDAVDDLGPAQPSSSQALALRTVVLEGPLRMGALASELRVSVATASRTVDALAADGFATRRRDPDDGRAVQVDATARGRRAYATSRRRFARALEGFLDELPEADRRELATALETVNRLVDRPPHSTRPRSTRSAPACAR
jgi:DNA-binding MarR family transcriptional regulator